MRGQSPFDLYNRILGGRLPEVLATWRAEGLSYEDIARRLSSEHGIEVAAPTVWRWLNSRREERAS